MSTAENAGDWQLSLGDFYGLLLKAPRIILLGAKIDKKQRIVLFFVVIT